MNYRDLPDDWSEQPLTGGILEDVLDLLVTEQARHEGALCIFLCDPGDRLMQPCQIDDLDGIPPELDVDRSRVFEPFVQALADFPPGCGLLVAIARRDGLSITTDDRRWRDALVEACAGRVRALDVHVVTMHGSRRVPALGAVA